MQLHHGGLQLLLGIAGLLDGGLLLADLRLQRLAGSGHLSHVGLVGRLHLLHARL